MASTYERLLDRMRRLCSMREYCSSDIRDKVMTALRREREKGDIDDLIFRGDAAPGPSER